MKRLVACLLVVGLILSFSGCKNDTMTAEEKIANLEKSNQELAEAAKRTKEEADRVAQQNQEYLDAYANATTESTSAEENTEATTVSLGDTISLDFMELTLENIYSADEITEDQGNNTFHKRITNDSNQMFWLETTMKNVGAKTFNLFGLHKYVAEMVFDDTYTYEAKIMKLIGFGNSEVKPLESVKVYIYAEIPKEMLEKYESVKIRFAFNSNFESGSTDDFDAMEHRYELVG